jgi:hypothetical protein
MRGMNVLKARGLDYFEVRELLAASHADTPRVSVVADRDEPTGSLTHEKPVRLVSVMPRASSLLLRFRRRLLVASGCCNA